MFAQTCSLLNGTKSI